MRPEQLPIEDKYFKPETDYRLLYQELAWHLHGVIHFRRPSKKHLAKCHEIAKFTGLGLNTIVEVSSQSCDAYDHIAVAVTNNGACYIGETRTNTDEGDRYSRRHGFRLAVKKSLEAMARGGGVDFEIGIEPPNGRLLNAIIRAKLEQFDLV